LAPLFSYGRLMPAMLMSGLRIEILWADAKTALKFADGPPPMPFKIDNPQFVLSSIQLSDSIQRSLNELSATNGLEIVYTDYERTPFTQNNALETAHIEIRKSCSRALKAFARVRQRNFGARVPPLIDEFGVEGKFTGGVGDEYLYNSFKAENNFPVYEYQWQLGSLYFPQQPVRAPNTVVGLKQVALSAYAHLLESCDKYHDGSRPMYTSFYNTHAAPDGYIDSATGGLNETVGTYTFDAHTIGVTLERSTMFNLAGVPVNNSRVLALHANLNGTSAEAGTPVRQVDVFLKYVKLARVFLNNVEVEQ